jgi:hypothetical protein
MRHPLDLRALQLLLVQTMGEMAWLFDIIGPYKLPAQSLSLPHASAQCGSRAGRTPPSQRPYSFRSENQRGNIVLAGGMMNQLHGNEMVGTF